MPFFTSRIAPDDGPWRVGGPTSRLFLDLIADRPVQPQEPLSPEGITLAYRHALIGLTANNPHPHLRDPTLPVYARLVSWQEIMVRHLGRLLDTLAEEAIPVTVIKGPFLAAQAYRTPQLRTFTDIDLLVRRHDQPRVLEILRSDPSVESIPPQGPAADKRDVPISDSSGRGFKVDLHWDLFSYRQLLGRADGAIEWAWDRAAGPIDHDVGPVWRLPEEVHLAFLCTHAVLDHRFRLILFRDLAEVARREVDWESLARFATRWGLRSATYLALHIARNTAEAAVPEGVLEDLRPPGMALGVAERILPGTDLVAFDGRRPHPLNLAMVLVHDDPTGRMRLAWRAPLAFPRWRRRTRALHNAP